MNKSVAIEETIEQFIARGGVVEIYPYIPPANARQEVSSSMIRSIIDMSEGELYFSSERRKKEKKPIKVDGSKLPTSLIEKLREKGIKIDG